MKKNNLIFVIAASFFSIAAASVLVAQASTTWQGPPSNCTSPEGSDCNVDGVVWLRSNPAATPQVGNINISGKTLVGGLDVNNASFTIDNLGNARNNYIRLQANGDLGMSPGKGIDVQNANNSSLLNIGNWATGGKYVDVSIYGNLQLHKTPANLTPSICFDDTDPATCRTTWPSGGGFTQAQADLLYVKKAGDTMTGDLTTGNLVANTSISAGNVISAPTLSLQKGGQTSSATLNNNFWSFNGDLGNTQYQPTSLVMTAKTWSANKLISLDMRSLGNFNTTIGSASFGDQDNPGVFTRTGGGKTAEVDILSNSGGETWGSMTGLNSSVPNAAGNTAGRFTTSDNARQVFLVGPTYALDVKGDANFQNRICLGGSCQNTWPTSPVTGVTVNGGLQLNGTTLGIQNCGVGQIMKSTGISTWSCQADNGLVTAVSGSSGVASTGGVTPNLTLDTVFTDGRYVKKSGDTIAGTLGVTGALTASGNLFMPTTFGIGFDGNRDNTGFLQLWSDGIFYWDLGTASKLYLRPTGGASSPIYFDAAAGKGYQTGGGSWGASSDARLKKNILPMQGALDQITKLQGYKFDWINPAEHGNQIHDGGFVAQQVEQTFPSWINQEKASGKDKKLVGNSDIKTLQLPFEFDALVVESIKQLKTENDALKAKNQELERRLEILEAKIK